MINTVRATIRLILFFIISLLTVVLVAVGNLFLSALYPKWCVRWKNIVIGYWARVISFVIGLDMTIKGIPPDPPFFMVSNHLSYIDVLPLWSLLDATFIAKSEIKSWPFFGVGTRILGVLFIDREIKRDVHRMNHRISETVTDTQGVILFPEGTSTHGEKVLPFNSPLLEYPAANEIPVSYTAVSYQSYDKLRPAYSNICWWGDMSFFSHFWELLKMPGFEAIITFGDHKIANKDRKILAKKLQQAVSQLFTPVDNTGGSVATAINSDK